MFFINSPHLTLVKLSSVNFMNKVKYVRLTKDITMHVIQKTHFFKLSSNSEAFVV